MLLECPGCGRYRDDAGEYVFALCPDCAQRNEIEPEDEHARRRDRKRCPRMNMSGAGLRTLKPHDPR